MLGHADHALTICRLHREHQDQGGHTDSGHSDTVTTTDAGASQQWRAIQSSHQFQLQRIQHRTSHILQDAATGYFPTEGLQRRIDLIDITCPERARHQTRIAAGLLGHASHRRGFVKSAKQHKEDRP